jgi:cephalosporin hydroxylase/nucleoside-diphosphate-sugar epimerase
MPTILVTGASGFVGRWAVDALSRNGFDVHGTSRRPMTNLDIVMHGVDLHDTAAVSSLIDKVQPTHLLLSAWTTAHGAFWTDPANETWAKSSVTMAEHFLKAGGRRIVLAGTCAEYDWLDSVLEAGPVVETAAQGSPKTLYGQAKRRAADAISKLAECAGASFATGRIFIPMGWAESRERFLPTIVNAMLDGQPAHLGSGEQIRDVMDVRDVGAALAALVLCDVKGAVNIGSGKGTALADVARRAGALGGHPELLQFGTQAARHGDPAQLVADISRLRDEVGFVPRYTLDDAIASAFDYWTQLRSTTVKRVVRANISTGSTTMYESDAEFEARKRRDIAAMAADGEFRELGRAWFTQSFRHRYSYNFRWMGLPIIQYPADIVAMQELIWNIKPKAIVETGVARGGSLVFYASMLELIGSQGRVVGVELDLGAENRAAITSHHMAHRIRLVDGSSIDQRTVIKVAELVGDDAPVLVVLDSHHGHDHVLAELRAYQRFVRKGSYIVVFDTVIEHLPEDALGGRPWGKGNNPKSAIDVFLAENCRFEIDRNYDDKLHLSVCPSGFLRCVRD